MLVKIIIELHKSDNLLSIVLKNDGLSSLGVYIFTKVILFDSKEPLLKIYHPDESLDILLT